MDDVNMLFVDARKILDEINKICHWEIERREEVFKEFVSNICKAKTIEEKNNSFDFINNWLKAITAVNPKTEDLCNEIRKMLGIGSGIKCGGGG